MITPKGTVNQQLADANTLKPPYLKKDLLFVSPFFVLSFQNKKYLRVLCLKYESSRNIHSKATRTV